MVGLGLAALVALSAPAAHAGGFQGAPEATIFADTDEPPALADQYRGLSIDELAARRYGGGEITVIEPMTTQADEYERYKISYPSDGLDIVGFMNIPKGQGDGPFPVVIVVHGYIDPAVYAPEPYQVLGYTALYANALSRNGYITIHPNLRNYPPSDSGPNPFRIGYAIDLLNLAAIVRERAGKPGLLEKADPERIGLMGHSMGGGASIRAMTVDPNIKAVVLYASTSADEYQNYEFILRWSGGTQGKDELATPPEIMEKIAPVNHLERVRAAVSIHQGLADEVLPVEWASELCQRLTDLGKTVECFTYQNQPHTFVDAGLRAYLQRMIEFFDKQLKGGGES
ncbi:MAG: alpha/beta fold hydrolase [Anaerolineae bacterium]|nr:alpha/beta fold hydrolase [Anaerolineae bacterium]